MKVSHFFEYVLFLLVSAPLLVLPLRVVQVMGSAVARFVYHLLGFRRRVIKENLRHAFPDLSEERRNEIADQSFRSVGTALLELIYFRRMTIEQIRRLIRVENVHLVHDAIQQGKGLILMTAHFGNWELCAQGVLAHTGVPMHIVIKSQSNKLIDAAVNSRRVRFGNSVVPMGDAVRAVLGALRNNEAVGMVGDQSAARESAWIEFFGRPVPTYRGPAVFSLKTGAPIVMGFAIRGEDGTYSLKLLKIDQDDLVGASESNVDELTRRHVAKTEEMIRNYPGQWMWMHRRWKHTEASDEQKKGGADEAG